MEDELMAIEDETGEYGGRARSGAVPADNMAAVLVILTSIFLIMSILMIGIRLYTAYDFMK